MMKGHMAILKALRYGAGVCRVKADSDGKGVYSGLLKGRMYHERLNT
jgi:hypothetical protein